MLAEQVLAHDDDGDPGRAEVLLRTAVNHPKARDVDRTRQQARGKIGDQGDIADLRDVMELDAVDGLVGRVMHERGVVGQLPLGPGGDAAIPGSLAARGNMGANGRLGVLQRFLAPVPGEHVIGDRIGTGQVERQQCGHRGGPALQEEDGVVVRDGHQLAQIPLQLPRRSR